MCESSHAFSEFLQCLLSGNIVFRVIVFNRMSMGHMIAHCHSMSLRLKHFYRFYQVRVWLYFGVAGKMQLVTREILQLWNQNGCGTRVTELTNNHL